MPSPNLWSYCILELHARYDVKLIVDAQIHEKFKIVMLKWLFHNLLIQILCDSSVFCHCEEHSTTIL